MIFLIVTAVLVPLLLLAARNTPIFFVMAHVFLTLVVQSSLGKLVTLSNVALPLDQHGEKIITGEASAMFNDGYYYFYFNNWGTCPGVNCCADPAGCATCCFAKPPTPYAPGCGATTNGSDPYGLYHTVQAYRTADLVTWTNLGTALTMASRSPIEPAHGPPGIEFRPCVVYNAKTKLFVMWYEDRGALTHAYQIATSPNPEGPFVSIAAGSGTMPGKGRIGDYTIFVDDDGKAYHTRTGFDIVELDETYTKPASLVASFNTPKASEGPTMFKRNGTYYVTAGTGCCACIGGSSVYVLSAPSIKGPWTFMGDVGSNPGVPFDKHSPHNFVTNAQGSAVLKVGDDHVYLGNQWNTGLRETPPGPRNHDLLYWGVFEFEDSAEGGGAAAPKIKQMVWSNTTTVTV